MNNGAAAGAVETEETHDETFDNMLGAAYAAAVALRDVPGARVSMGWSLTEEQVEKFADAFEVEVTRQVSASGIITEPALIFSFEGRYEAVLSGGKHDVVVTGQGSRPATAAEATEHSVNILPDMKVVEGADAALLVEAAERAQ